MGMGTCLVTEFLLFPFKEGNKKSRRGFKRLRIPEDSRDIESCSLTELLLNMILPVQKRERQTNTLASRHFISNLQNAF